MTTIVCPVSKKKLIAFIFKLAANMLLELDNPHVYSQQHVVSYAKEETLANFYSFISSRTIRIHFHGTYLDNLADRIRLQAFSNSWGRTPFVLL